MLHEAVFPEALPRRLIQRARPRQRTRICATGFYQPKNDIEIGIARAAHRYYERFLRAEAAHRQAIANPEVISEAESMGGIAGRR